MSDVEEWRKVAGFPRYEVSSLGRVRSTHGRTTRIIGGSLDTWGYLQVTLSAGPPRSRASIHRLVCAAFHGDPWEDSWQAAHGDGDKLNNSAQNVRWASAHENQRDRVEHGTHNRGERCGTSKLLSADIKAIRARYAAGERSFRDLGAEFGVHSMTVRSVISGKSWAHVVTS